MLNHHPEPELLTAFAAGSLPLSQALCVSAHIEHCSECQTNNQRLVDLGAQVFAALAPAQASPQLLDSVLAKLDDAPAPSPTPARTSSSAIPRSLQQFIPDDYDALNWHYMSPSIRVADLCTDTNGAKVQLLRIKAGGKAATHTHSGNEYTTVLAGSFSDETGIYQHGDFVVRNSADKHKPMATKDAECICLTVTEAPIQFTGFFARLLNPFLRRNHLA